MKLREEIAEAHCPGDSLAGVQSGRDGLQGRQGKHLDVQIGDRFTVLPGDAQVTLRRGLVAAAHGPFQPFGGAVPGSGCGLSFEGRHTVGNAFVVSTAEQAMLASLGYLQDDGDQEGVGESGRVDCP